MVVQEHRRYTRQRVNRTQYLAHLITVIFYAIIVTTIPVIILLFVKLLLDNTKSLLIDAIRLNKTIQLCTDGGE